MFTRPYGMLSKHLVETKVDGRKQRDIRALIVVSIA